MGPVEPHQARITQIPQLAPDVAQMQTTLLDPSVRVRPTAPPRMQQRIAEHHAAAQEALQAAEQWNAQIQRDGDRFVALVTRWRAAVERDARTPGETVHLDALEDEVLHLAQHLARARHRWNECCLIARRNEEAADLLRSYESRESLFK